jgi:mannose-6-phosphate isomerase-like protein (cupin superfamily)
MKNILKFAMVGLVAVAPVVLAQSLNPVDVNTASKLHDQAAELRAQATSRPDGTASVTLDKYKNHYTMLIVRTKPGGAEQHNHVNDFFIVEDGEATIFIGGTIVNPKETEAGEVRGTGLQDAVPHVVHSGDIIHIASGIPHQTVPSPGKTFTYFVIKVAD